MVAFKYFVTFLGPRIIHTFVGLAFGVMSTQDEIVTSLTSLYRLFVALGYLTEDEISWSPHDTIPFNVSKCVDLGYDPSAIDLLQKIPWTTKTVPIYYESMPVVYSCDDELELSRDPTNYLIDDPDDPQPVDGWILPLTYGQRYGNTILLDAKEGDGPRVSFCNMSRSALSFSAFNIILTEGIMPSVPRLCFPKRLTLSSHNERNHPRH